MQFVLLELDISTWGSSSATETLDIQRTKDEPSQRLVDTVRRNP